ncbi:hypothetical protein HPB51_027819 [Rhipicephalus microplus]|uniref:CCHC-type domain-containing protein n=1 Tax=Rhipicephalus microplus TaxID=6941 RepID=A0A9J6CYW3_RHIMP|nr:hypothetical protein HPB51_027819 [Rhipicephalus microplus]
MTLLSLMLRNDWKQQCEAMTAALYVTSHLIYTAYFFDAKNFEEWSSPQGHRRFGSCHMCGMMGHYIRNCPHKDIFIVKKKSLTDPSFSDYGVCSYWSLAAPVPRSHHLLLSHGRTRRLCCPRIMRWDCSCPQINLSSEHLGLRTSCPAVDRINKHRGFQSAI